MSKSVTHAALINWMNMSKFKSALSTIGRLLIIQFVDIHRMGTNRVCPSQTYLAERLGVSDRSIRRHLKKLRQAGLIKWKFIRNANGTYYSLYDISNLLKEVEKHSSRQDKAKDKTRTKRLKDPDIISQESRKETIIDSQRSYSFKDVGKSISKNALKEALRIKGGQYESMS